MPRIAVPTICAPIQDPGYTERFGEKAGDSEVKRTEIDQPLGRIGILNKRRV